MKKLKLVEQKKILVEMLKYIDDICKKNNIQYTLIGGSLIGAIRHSGFVPWDDDIDIILLPKEYKRLINILSKENKYYILNPSNGDYPYPYAKLVDKNTVLIEENAKIIKNYGVYVDIFQYHYVSNNHFIQILHYWKIIIFKSLLGSCIMSDEFKKTEKNLLKRIKNIIAETLGISKLKKIYNNMCYSKKETKYILSNWPCYGFKQEIQKTLYFNQYKKIKFETIDAMITTEYDNVLTTTFGDYMKLPPKEKRVSNHNTTVYWKDKNENIKK